jgi:hypothetical protein
MHCRFYVIFLSRLKDSVSITRLLRRISDLEDVTTQRLPVIETMT